MLHILPRLVVPVPGAVWLPVHPLQRIQHNLPLESFVLQTHYYHDSELEEYKMWAHFELKNSDNGHLETK